VRAWQTPCPAPTPAPTPFSKHFDFGHLRDAHGCHLSGGYFYCEPLKECVRPFETHCPVNATHSSGNPPPPRSYVLKAGIGLGLLLALGLLFAFYSGRCCRRRKQRIQAEQEFRKQFDKVEMTSLAPETTGAEFV